MYLTKNNHEGKNSDITSQLVVAEFMRPFTLTYDGPLLASGNDPPVQSMSKLDNIWAIRNRFESQMVRVYQTHPTLTSNWSAAQRVRVPIVRNGINFCALVRPWLGLGCELDIKMLVNHEPGSVVTQAGDLDNRIKTLFDALRVPKDNEFRGRKVELSDGHVFPCLLEDDSAITKLSIISERWLDSANRAENEVHLLIAVRVVVLKPNQINEVFAMD